MKDGTGGKGGFAGDGAIDVSGRQGVLLGQPVGHDRNGAPMKKVKQAIVDRTQANPQFMDAIAEEISFGPPEFMPQERKPRERGPTFDESFHIGFSQVRESVHHGCGTGLFLKEDKMTGRHEVSKGIIAILR